MISLCTQMKKNIVQYTIAAWVYTETQEYSGRRYTIWRMG